MGSGMAKYSDHDTYYKRRRGARNNSDIDKCFSKEYSEYWKVEPKKIIGDNFANDRNEYGTAGKSLHDSPLREKRRTSQFVSSFSSAEKNNYSSYSSQKCKR